MGDAGPAVCEGDLSLHLKPCRKVLEYFNIYSTSTRYFLIGCDEPPPYTATTRYRVLKIDRTENTTLDLVDDGVSYTPSEIEDILVMIDASSAGSKSAFLESRLSAYGVLGFVRFCRGYYLSVITKRRRVAMIGPHFIYKIEATEMLPIFNPDTTKTHPNESRYVRIFQNVDITSNFYFSYSYDITRPLQTNMYSPPSSMSKGYCEDEPESEADFTGDADSRINPDMSFVWNSYLLEPFGVGHSAWKVFAIHGFLGQTKLSVFGRPIYVTLIARRSRKFAGTRFLKRGADFHGEPANNVESEQIVHDASTLRPGSGHYTSYLQMRASIPCFWSQDLSTKIKPPISIDRRDPFSTAAALHFDRLLNKYGAPVIILNLVKKKEKKPREQVVSQELSRAVDYLNQFLDDRQKLRHICWDMHRTAKSKEGNVLERLDQIADSAMREVGFFHSGPELLCNKLRPGNSDKPVGGIGYSRDRRGRNQTGIIRVNCVDCLDRTNTAQFMFGLNALGQQLYTLGIVESPGDVRLDSDAFHIMEELYEDMGDTLALQYGGSQLVNRIQTYRKSSPWTTGSRDILNTVTRYYSNSFTDVEKQAAINVFLGMYRPACETKDVWALDTDLFLHFPELRTKTERVRQPCNAWCTILANCTPAIDKFDARPFAVTGAPGIEYPHSPEKPESAENPTLSTPGAAELADALADIGTASKRDGHTSESADWRSTHGQMLPGDPPRTHISEEFSSSSTTASEAMESEGGNSRVLPATEDSSPLQAPPDRPDKLSATLEKRKQLQSGSPSHTGASAPKSSASGSTASATSSKIRTASSNSQAANMLPRPRKSIKLYVLPSAEIFTVAQDRFKIVERLPADTQVLMRQLWTYPKPGRPELSRMPKVPTGQDQLNLNKLALKSCQRADYIAIRKVVVDQGFMKSSDFDVKVKTMVASWAGTKTSSLTRGHKNPPPAPAVYTDAALIVASRRGIHFSTATALASINTLLSQPLSPSDGPSNVLSTARERSTSTSLKDLLTSNISDDASRPARLTQRSPSLLFPAFYRPSSMTFFDQQFCMNMNSNSQPDGRASAQGSPFESAVDPTDDQPPDADRTTKSGQAPPAPEEGSEDSGDEEGDGGEIDVRAGTPSPSKLSPSKKTSLIGLRIDGRVPLGARTSNLTQKLSDDGCSDVPGGTEGKKSFIDEAKVYKPARPPNSDIQVYRQFTDVEVLAENLGRMSSPTDASSAEIVEDGYVKISRSAYLSPPRQGSGATPRKSPPHSSLPNGHEPGNIGIRDLKAKRSLPNHLGPASSDENCGRSGLSGKPPGRLSPSGTRANDRPPSPPFHPSGKSRPRANDMTSPPPISRKRLVAKDRSSPPITKASQIISGAGYIGLHSQASQEYARFESSTPSVYTACSGRTFYVGPTFNLFFPFPPRVRVRREAMSRSGVGTSPLMCAAPYSMQEHVVGLGSELKTVLTPPSSDVSSYVAWAAANADVGI